MCASVTDLEIPPPPEQYHLNNSPFGQGLPHPQSNHSTVGLNKYASLKAVGKSDTDVTQMLSDRWPFTCRQRCRAIREGCPLSDLTTSLQPEMSPKKVSVGFSAGKCPQRGNAWAYRRTSEPDILLQLTFKCCQNTVLKWHYPWEW